MTIRDVNVGVQLGFQGLFGRFLAVVFIVTAFSQAMQAQTAATGTAESEAQPKANQAKIKTGNSDTLDTVVVRDTAVTPSDEAAFKLEQVDGGTNLVRASEISKGTVANIADALAFQPGIYAQSVNGGEATRLSIRGSGIIRSGFLFGWGNVLMLDGQRMYGASGNPYEAIEPLAVDRIEVLRGANAFEYGPISLGGSINYVSKTGYDASPIEARFEAGSFGYFHEQVSSGLVEGPADYYASVTRFDKEGYRDNTEGHSTRVVANVGYQFNPDIKTRFYFRFANQYQEDAGYLTWQQLKANPEQSQFGNQVRDRVNPGTYVAGNTTSFQIDPESSVEVGWQYDNSPIDSPNSGPTSTYFEFQQIASSIRYKREDELFGRRSNSLFSFISHYSLLANWKAVIAGGATAAIRPADQSDWTVLANNDTEVVDNLWLNTGVAGIYQYRETSVSSGLGPLVGQSISEDYLNVAPKLGVRYEFTPTIQAYTNVSRSIDTPSANSYIRTNALFVPQQFLDLKEASATTVEVGTKGQEGIFDWNLAFYHSWVSNELLTVQIAPGVTTASNATPTIHQGIEAGLNVQLWRDLAVDGDPTHPQQQVVLRQGYTWNNFTFAGDPAFGKNELAGVPIHLYQAELAYEHISGFYAGVNVQSSLSAYAADFANTIYAPGYAIMGAKIGYRQPTKGWETFLEVRNLLNDKYAPVVSPVYNAAGVDSNVYAPGEGFGVNGGVAYRF